VIVPQVEFGIARAPRLHIAVATHVLPPPLHLDLVVIHAVAAHDGLTMMIGDLGFLDTAVGAAPPDLCTQEVVAHLLLNTIHWIVNEHAALARIVLDLGLSTDGMPKLPVEIVLQTIDRIPVIILLNDTLAHLLLLEDRNQLLGLPTMLIEQLDWQQ